MSMASQHETAFRGVRLRFDSDRSYDDVVAAVLADIGDKPVPINDYAAQFDSWEAYEHEVQSHVGPSGFILFGLFNYGAWITKTGIDRKVLRIILGNPLIAITMIRHDVTASLFAPVELLVISEPGGTSAVTYVVPSSLMVVEPNPPLLAAALELDAKLLALVEKVTGSA